MYTIEDTFKNNARIALTKYLNKDHKEIYAEVVTRVAGSLNVMKY
jgi:hypothetical protein